MFIFRRRRICGGEFVLPGRRGVGGVARPTRTPCVWRRFSCNENAALDKPGLAKYSRRMKQGLLHNFLFPAIAAFMCFGCVHTTVATKKPAPPAIVSDTNAVVKNSLPPREKEKDPGLRRSTYTPRVYPVDERGFSPVDAALAKAYAREEMVTNDDEGSLNPFVLKVITGYPLDGSYQYHCSWKPREYDIYNGVTQDQWYRGMVVAKAYPDGSRCSYCCGFTFEVFVRAMKLRNLQASLDPDDFNGMTFNDLFNALQFWYIEGQRDSEARAITSYGLGMTLTNFDDARPGDFVSYSTTPSGGHSVISSAGCATTRRTRTRSRASNIFPRTFPATASATRRHTSVIRPRTATASCVTTSTSATSARSKITVRSTARKFRSATPTQQPSRRALFICRSRKIERGLRLGRRSPTRLVCRINTHEPGRRPALRVCGPCAD